jgi:DNA-binding LacI/PurR family transcriptional regulator
VVSSLLEQFELRAEAGVSTPNQIAEFLRQQIQTGVLPVGTRLPASSKLAAKWGVGIVSVQKAMTVLKAAGLIERRARRGTFVRDPEVGVELAILVGVNLADEASFYGRALVKALQDEMLVRGWHALVYDGLNARTHGDTGQRPLAYRRFMDDAQRGVFSGAIQVAMSIPSSMQIDKSSDLPSVRLGQIARISDVMNDYYAFGHDAIAWLAGQGKQRITCLGPTEGGEDYEGIREAAAEAGLPKPQIIPFAAFNVGHMEAAIHDQMLGLIEKWESTACWPDALVVSDDVAMRAVSLALMEKGAGEEMTVLALANAQVRLRYGRPVVRYEFASRRNACEAMDILWKRMCGEDVPGLPLMLRGTIRES